MKNLFIFWVEPLNLTGGGIHRCIVTLLKYLPSRGFNVYYLYSQDSYETFHYQTKDGKDCVFTLSDLRDFLITQKCELILGQDAVFTAVFTKVVKNLNLPKVKFINQYHGSLLYLTSKLTWDYLKFEWANNPHFSSRIGIIMRGLFYPLWRFNVRRVQNNIFRYNYINSDLTLFLSEFEIPIMEKIIGDTSLKKCVAIPNPLSWEEISTPDILKDKQKEVLIVSRINNPEKRIDLALKVWKILENKGATKDWTLRIVGDGIHKDYLIEMARVMHLHNVVWESRQDPRPFYKRASIFLLTSVTEGWALTLTESMQMGVVPIAFNSYPAVNSIITDGYDGYLIPTKDLKKMAEKLMRLMQNKETREQLALNGLQSCRRFTIDSVMDQWRDMLNKL